MSSFVKIVARLPRKGFPRLRLMLKSARRATNDPIIEEYKRRSSLGKHSSNEWIRKSSNIGGWINEGEHEFLWELATRPVQGHILEIGTWQGKSACILAGAIVESGAPSKVFCIDTFMMDGTDYQVSLHKHFGSGFGTFYDFINNAKKEGFSEVIVPLAARSRDIIPFLNIELKLAFIDGTHDFDNVSQDIQSVKPLIVKGGIIALHDSNDFWPGVGQAIQAHLANDSAFRFYRKVNSLETYIRES
jgi:hypothetical protein